MIKSYNLTRRCKQASTHMPLLIKCVQATDGGILEMGTGIASTPLLHWLASERKRRLISYDDNIFFYNLAKQFQSKYHRIRLVEDWSQLKIDGHWSVALIDQSIPNRVQIAIYLKDKVDYMVIHDTEFDSPYHYELVWPHFKYRYNYTQQRPNTSVVSNFKDLSWLQSKTL